MEQRTHRPEYYEIDRRELRQFLALQGVHAVGRVLNVGCGAGADHKWLRELGASELVGIEPVKEAAQIASQRYDTVTTGRIEEWRSGDGQSFDLILFADVLEHLIDPAQVLRRSLDWLSPAGSVLVSLPNVRHISVIAPLVFQGRWDYQLDGVMDRTHLRFFTRRTARELLESSGLSVMAMRRYGASRVARRVAELAPPLGEFIQSQVFLLARRSVPR